MTESLTSHDTKQSLVEIPFNGKKIVASPTGDSYVVSLRRCCENMGIQFQRKGGIRIPRRAIEKLAGGKR